MRHAGGGSESDDTGEGNGHAERFVPGDFFEAKEDGESERVDGRHANDDGGVRDVGVTQAEGEEELIDGNAEEAEVGEGPEIVTREP